MSIKNSQHGGQPSSLAAQDVEVQMRDALSAPIARIHHHSEAVFLKTQLLHQLRQDFLYVDQDIRGMP